MRPRPHLEPSPASAARNARLTEVLELVDGLTITDSHRRRATVRLAGNFPPPGLPTDDDVRQAVDDTAPTEEPTP